MRAAALTITFALAAPAFAADDARLELGIGATALSLPDYRGSDEQQGYLLPLPYLSYQGERLQVSRAGVRGLLFQGERSEFDLSLNATPPVKSEKNRARAGMPALDPTLEIGPSFKYRLSAADDPVRVELVLPLRAVASFDDWRVRHVGNVFNPKIGVEWRQGQDWGMGLSAGALFGDRRQHAYFYDVDARYATAERPAYRARGGYGGLQGTLSASRSFGDWWLGTFLRADQVGGASFADSPLVKRKTNLSAGIGLAWRFYRSDAR